MKWMLQPSVMFTPHRLHLAVHTIVWSWVVETVRMVESVAIPDAAARRRFHHGSSHFMLLGPARLASQLLRIDACPGLASTYAASCGPLHR